MRYNEDILVALAADCILWKESRSVYATELVMVHRGTGLGITGDSSTIASSLKKRLRMVRAVSKLAVSNTSPQLVTFPLHQLLSQSPFLATVAQLSPHCALQQSIRESGVSIRRFIQSPLCNLLQHAARKKAITPPRQCAVITSVKLPLAPPLESLTLFPL